MGELIGFEKKKLIGSKPKPPPAINVGIIVQARMTSARFPGKSMALLLEKPVLEWVLERVKLVRGPKRAKMTYILAVPDADESEPMLQLADKLDVENFCGSELNVLRRYYEAALFFKLDYIVRITGDCPFIDPVVCAEVTQLCVWRKLDYTSNIYPKRTYPQGLDCECFTMDCLEAAYKLSDIISDYEHVTPWMQRAEEIKKGSVQQRIDQSDKNWCIDYPEDIKRLEEEACGKKIKLIGVNDDDTTG